MRTPSEHAQAFLIALVAICALDKLIITPSVAAGLANKKYLKPVRWFFLHFAANMMVCATAAIPLWMTLTDPVNAANTDKYPDDGLFGSASAWPLTIINGVHVYHMVGGFSLSSADYFHHLLFVPLLGFPGQVLAWGPVQPAGAFFISGLPGGLTYLMLGLVKLGLLPGIKEKQITANLNSWLRVPGILITSFLVYQAAVTGNHSLPSVWVAVPSVVLGPYNALYYNKQAVANFTMHYMTQLFGQDDVVKQRLDSFRMARDAGPRKGMWASPTSAAVLEWKDAIRQPQRGS